MPDIDLNRKKYFSISLKKDIGSVFVSRAVCLCISIFSMQESALGKIVFQWSLESPSHTQTPECGPSPVPQLLIFCVLTFLQWKGRDGKERADGNLQIRMRFQEDFFYFSVFVWKTLSRQHLETLVADY